MNRFVSFLIAFALAAASLFAQSNKSVMIPGNVCSATAATLAITAQGLQRAAAGNGAIQFFTTDAAGGTITLNCDLTSGFNHRIGSSARITSVSLYYGVQTTGISAIAAAVFNTVTMATSGAAAAGTVASAGGSLTVTPAVLQLTVTTTGQCFNERVAFGTPINVTDRQRLTMEQVFTFGMAISTLQICGIQINYTDPL